MWITKQHPVYAFCVIVGILFFVFTVVSFLPLILPDLGPDWWINFSLFSDILGTITIISNFYLISTGRLQPMNPRDFAVAVVDELELRETYRNLEEVPGSDEVPENLDYDFTQQRLARAISILNDSGFTENAMEFEAVSNLISDGHLTDAIIRTRRSVEVLFTTILRRRDVSVDRRKTSFRFIVDKLVHQRLLNTQERSVIIKFYMTANKTIHETWSPSDEESTILISMIAGIVEVIIQRYNRF